MTIVLIGAVPGSVEEFLDSALPLAADGYPMELVVLAVRAADSRLATALRYARALQIGGTGRFTTRSGHDTCFRALGDIVAVAERHPQIAAITVVRRDGQACCATKPTAPAGHHGRSPRNGSAHTPSRRPWRSSSSTMRCAGRCPATAAKWTTSPRSPGSCYHLACSRLASTGRTRPSGPARQQTPHYDSLSSLSRAA
ncbi:zeta toxin family protein [Streptomyces sp. NPDC006872]|uniref:zeta toxin family protein n=1 Tax=Streptomyces sp. NPDC006872 TaxID=3155720 RepID=UPI0033DC67C2